MSLEKFNLKKVKRKALFASGIVIIATVIGFGGYQIADNINSVNATKNNEFDRPNGSLKIDIPKIDAYIENGAKAPMKKKISSVPSSLESSYDSRTHGLVSRQENQAGEGLCWAYAFTTTAETYLKTSGLVSNTIELSPKQLDYATAPASEAFSDSTTNKYDDFIKQNIGRQRSLTDGGNSIIATLASSGKYSLTEDSAFFGKMKLNDSNTLGSFDSYGDFIVNRYNLALEDYLAHGSTDLPLEYTTKQKINDVFDDNANRYAVTGYKYIALEYYSQGDVSEDQEALIAEIKNNILNYGAVVISTYFDKDNCMYVNGQDYTIIDRTTNSFSSACNSQTGHDMTLVGWDDNWAYQDNGVSKTGAFIIQNSYGDDNNNYYFAYSSNGQVGVISEMRKSDSYDNAYDLSDYNRTIKTGTYETEFDFSVSGSSKINSLAISTMPITGSENLGWDVYVKSGNGNYIKVGRLPDEYSGEKYSLRSIDNLNLNVNGNFSVKVVYDDLGNNIHGFDADVFAKNVAPLMTVTAYTSGKSDTQPDSPTSDGSDTDSENQDTNNSDDESTGTQSGDFEEEDIPVPNTSADTTKTGSAPDTGGNTNNLETSLVTFSCALPIFVVILIMGRSAYGRKKHIHFNHE